MQRIHKLSDVLVNRISAGEVVERPSAALKEIMENSIDAGATNIEVTLEHGGIKSIIVKDNGRGIHHDDLILALERNATSKISSEDDLYNIHTLGFRGEGIASISAVSDFTLASFLRDAAHGYTIHSNYGVSSIPIPDSINFGTKVSVNDIFHKVPARKKFLKSDTTEYFHCKNIFERLAISSPSISMKLTHNNKIIYNLAESNLKQRLLELFQDPQINSAVEVSEDNSQFTLSGLIFHPSYVKLKKELQYVYVNNRYIKDKVILNALKQALGNTLHSGDNQLNYVLFITIDPQEIDVNVHPSKTEVRFRESNMIHNFIYQSINKSLAKPINQQHLNTNRIEKNQLISNELTNTHSQNLEHSSNNLSSTQTNYPTYTRDDLSNNKTSNKTYDNPNNKQNYESNRATGDNTKAISNWLDNLANIKDNSRQATMGLFSNELSYQELVPPLGFAVCQLNAIYILSKTTDGLIIVDMHAAHERILLEKLKLEYKNGGIISQNLLFAIEIDTNILESECATLNQLNLAKLGFIYEVGENNISINAIPMLVNNNSVHKIFIAVLHDIINYGMSNIIDSHIEDILSTISCHNAVRAKDELSIDEMNALLRHVETTPNAGFCNHGRPTWFKLSIDKLDQVFLRGQ